MSTISYLDCAASHPILPEAKDAMCSAADFPSNLYSSHPGALHNSSQAIILKDIIAEKFSYLFPKIDGSNVIITRSGTEANYLALNLCNKDFIVEDIGHSSTYLQRAACSLPKMESLAVGPAKSRVHTTICPFTGDENLFIEKDLDTHVDHVQGFLKIDVPKSTSISTVSISSHKIGGPAGIGALIFRDRKSADICRQQYFPGSLSYPLIAGFKAALITYGKYKDNILSIRDYFIDTVCNSNGNKWRVISDIQNPNNNHFHSICLLSVKRPKEGILGINSTLELLFSKGVWLSETSSCSKTINPSILDKYKIDTSKEDLIRASWGVFTKKEEIDHLTNILNKT